MKYQLAMIVAKKFFSINIDGAPKTNLYLKYVAYHDYKY